MEESQEIGIATKDLNIPMLEDNIIPPESKSDDYKELEVPNRIL